MTWDAALLQWVINQGVAVGILIWAIGFLGSKIDTWNTNMAQLTAAINAHVAAHTANSTPNSHL